MKELNSTDMIGLTMILLITVYTLVCWYKMEKRKGYIK